jgi:hypothetical protein
MAKMTRLEAFKGREHGQNDRRKREHGEKIIDKVADVIRSGGTNEMAKQKARPDFDGHFRFPREKKSNG